MDQIAGEPLERFQLFRTGGPLPDGRELQLENDPPYVEGTEVVLFLVPGVDGTFIPFGPDGRFTIVGGGLRPAAEDGPGKALGALSVNDLGSRVREVRGA